MKNDYWCIVREDGMTSCNHSTWGQTPYCFWHYLFVQFRMFYLWMKPQKRAIAEALHNPDAITDWTTPAWLKTRIVLAFIIFNAIITLLLWAAGVSGEYTLIEIISGILVVNVFAIAIAMMLGNSDILLPKILFANLAGILIISISIILLNPPAPTRSWGISQMIGSLGMTLFIWPKSFNELGTSRLNYLGLGLILIGAVVRNFAGGDPDTATGGVGPSFVDMLGRIEVVAGIAFVVSLLAAVIGSLLAVQKLWQSEEVFYRCMRPSQMKVMYLGAFAGVAAGVVMGFILLKILLSSNVLGFVAAQITAAVVGCIVTRQYGISVFSKNIRKANLGYRDFHFSNY